MVKLSLEEIQPPRRGRMPAHPKNRDDDPVAYDAAQDWKAEQRRRKEINDKRSSEVYERQVDRRAEKAEAAFNSARFVTKRLEEIANQNVVNGNDIVKASEEQRQEKLDKVHDYKKGLRAAVTAAELGFSGASLLGAYANWRNWANAASISKRTIANLLQKAQLPMQVTGTLIDAYQTYDELNKDNVPEGLYNAGSAGLGSAGIVGASDVFLNSRFHSPKVDRILDVLGIIQNTGDFIKFGYDTFNKKTSDYE